MGEVLRGVLLGGHPSSTEGGSMPDWQPNWTDVEFDHAAAEQAVAACKCAAKTIESTLNTEVRCLSSTTQDWSGKARDDFDTGEPKIRQLRAQVREDLDRLAQAIVAAAEAAKAEQTKREADRQRWRDEDEAERRCQQRRPGQPVPC